MRAKIQLVTCGTRNIILLTSPKGSFPGTAFFFFEIFGSPTFLNVFQNLSCHLPILIWRISPKLICFWSPGLRTMLHGEAGLGAFIVIPQALRIISKALVVCAGNISAANWNFYTLNIPNSRECLLEHYSPKP